MENRLLMLLILVVAILATGWVTWVLLWDPQPQVIVDADSNSPVSIPETVIHQSAAPVTPPPVADIDASRQQISESPYVMDASMGIDELYRMVSAMGIDPSDFRAQLQEFYCGAGWPPADTQYSLAGCNLEQPYYQYDMGTLQQLAEGGDMWAQQILADQIAMTRPAEAIQWYQRAAAQGSANAAAKIGRIYDQARTDFLNQANQNDTVFLEQTLALQDSSESPRTLAAAWTGVSNLMAHRMVGSMSLGRFGPALSQQQFEQACDMAEQMFGQLDQESRQANQEPIPRRVAPMLVAAPDSIDNRCPGPMWADPQIDDCHAFEMSFDSIPTGSGMPKMPGWICPD